MGVRTRRTFFASVAGEVPSGLSFGLGREAAEGDVGRIVLFMIYSDLWYERSH